MICSDKEIKAQLERIYMEADAVGLTEWEMKFITDLYDRDIRTLTQKQKEIITKIHLKYF